MAELAGALDLGSSVFDVGVQVLSPAPKGNWREPIFLLPYGGIYEDEMGADNRYIVSMCINI